MHNSLHAEKQQSLLQTCEVITVKRDKSEKYEIKIKLNKMQFSLTVLAFFKTEHFKPNNKVVYSWKIHLICHSLSYRKILVF